ncbi:unnamed protein product [Orchesella dallaii]|uniref:Uncharacterized protein n=1 Tax=Orchesella dallaii TaxID=48710 RepID=A0ABP1QMF3_9HEXA
MSSFEGTPDTEEESRNQHKINLQLIKATKSTELENILLQSTWIPEQILPEVRECKTRCGEYWDLAACAVRLIYTDINRFSSYRPICDVIQDKFDVLERRVNAFHAKMRRGARRRTVASTRSCPMIQKEAFEMSVEELEEMIPKLDEETKNATDMTTWFLDAKSEWDSMKGDLNVELNDCIQRMTALTQEIQMLISNIFIVYIPVTITLYNVTII